MKLIALIIVFCLIAVPKAFAQKAGDATIGLPAHPGDATAGRDTVETVGGYRVPDAPTRPRWLKAAAFGAVGGALLALAGHALAAESDAEGRSLSTDLMIGVVGGAAIAGTTIAFFDWICSPDSPSRQAGLCGASSGPRVLPGR